jgi:hypothetical protein
MARHMPDSPLQYEDAAAVLSIFERGMVLSTETSAYRSSKF